MTLLKKSNTAFPSLFDEFFRDDWLPSFINNKVTTPAVNIKETDKGYQLEVAAPGMKRNDFSVSMDDNMLTIEAERKEEHEDKNDKYTRKEFSYNSFSRSFQLPEGVMTDKVSATYKDGVLLVELPVDTKKVSPKAKTIAVK